MAVTNTAAHLNQKKFKKFIFNHSIRSSEFRIGHNNVGEFRQNLSFRPKKNFHQFTIHKTRIHIFPTNETAERIDKRKLEQKKNKKRKNM